jgi:hypothetical protein
VSRVLVMAYMSEVVTALSSTVVRVCAYVFLRWVKIP